MSAGKFQGTYDPEKVIVTIEDRVITGFSSDDFIKVKYDDDRFFKLIGIDGEVGRVKNLSYSGSIEFTLMSSSDDNKWFSGLNLNSRFNRKTLIKVGVRDLSGKTIVFADKCWIRSTPEVVFSDEISDRNWVLDCPNLQMVIGGSNSNSIVDAVISKLF